jgi:hypothetical protein
VNLGFGAARADDDHGTQLRIPAGPDEDLDGIGSSVLPSTT